MNCIETINLTHKFSDSEIALDNVNLKIGEGDIYGFLGPNGAGKTTTLKLILGLLKKQQGEIFIFGKTLAENRLEILKNLGSLIESPSIYEHLTAAENLRVWQKIYRCPETSIGETLELVGLGRTGAKKAGRFSLGMKQRLSIAVALLHRPSLLILDEPTNGLDPNGILEIRELLQNLNRTRGITILISSHLLAEIEKLVTHLGIIHHGKLLFQGTLPELNERQRQTSRLVFETSDNDRAHRLLTEHGIAARSEPGKILMPVPGKEKIAAINRRLIAAGIDVYRIGTINDDLETIFFDVIDGQSDETASS